MEEKDEIGILLSSYQNLTVWVGDFGRHNSGPLLLKGLPESAQSDKGLHTVKYVE